jgi:hypothetical protein
MPAPPRSAAEERTPPSRRGTRSALRWSSGRAGEEGRRLVRRPGVAHPPAGPRRRKRIARARRPPTRPWSTTTATCLTRPPRRRMPSRRVPSGRRASVARRLVARARSASRSRCHRTARSRKFQISATAPAARRTRSNSASAKETSAQCSDCAATRQSTDPVSSGRSSAFASTAVTSEPRVASCSRIAATGSTAST